MATKKFTDFPLQVPIQNSDFLVGYKADGSTEIKTTVNDLSNNFLSKVNLTEIASTSSNWNSTYTTVNTNSALWGTGGVSVNLTEVANASANWNSTYTTVRANSAQWATDNTYDLGVRALTGKYESTYTTVRANSAQWAIDNTVNLSEVATASANWNNAYTTLRSNSGDWMNVETVVMNNSASWSVDSAFDLGVRALTAKYESTYTTVNSNSATWGAGGNGASKEYVHDNFVPLSGGTLTDILSSLAVVTTTLTSISTIIAPGVTSPRVQMSIGVNWGLANTNNNTDTIIQWNQIDYNTNTSYFSASTANRNFQILQPGYYRIEVRYASYDLLAATNFLRVQVRGSTSGNINTGNGGSMIGTVDQGYIGTTANGEGMKSGVISLSANITPFWIIGAALHSGATGGTGTQGYPVFNNVLGTQPYMLIERISDLP